MTKRTKSKNTFGNSMTQSSVDRNSSLRNDNITTVSDKSVKRVNTNNNKRSDSACLTDTGWPQGAPPKPKSRLTVVAGKPPVASRSYAKDRRLASYGESTHSRSVSYRHRVAPQGKSEPVQHLDRGVAPCSELVQHRRSASRGRVDLTQRSQVSLPWRVDS